MNYMNLKIKAVSKNEAFARSVVGAFCVELNPTIDEINDIKTAVSEAVTNCVVHAYENDEGEIELNASIDGGILHIEIKDTGIGIPDIQKARQPFYTTNPTKNAPEWALRLWNRLWTLWKCPKTSLTA